MNMATSHKIIIRNASLRGQSIDLYITGNRISRIVSHQPIPVSYTDSLDVVYIDAQGMNVFPAFYNMHVSIR